MSQTLMTLASLWDHWEGHRRLTVRTVEAFPEDKLFSYKVEPMRTFGKIATEIINVEHYFLASMISSDWTWKVRYKGLASKEELLSAFHETRQCSRERWSQLTLPLLHKVEMDAGEGEMSNLERVFYLIDNEVHHRAQGYVYLRLLGSEPPAFYER